MSLSLAVWKYGGAFLLLDGSEVMTLGQGLQDGEFLLEG